MESRANFKGLSRMRPIKWLQIRAQQRQNLRLLIIHDNISNFFINKDELELLEMDVRAAQVYCLFYKELWSFEYEN